MIHKKKITANSSAMIMKKVIILCLKTTILNKPHMGLFTRGCKYKAKISNTGSIYITDNIGLKRVLKIYTRRYCGYHYKRFQILYPEDEHEELMKKAKEMKRLLFKQKG